MTHRHHQDTGYGFTLRRILVLLAMVSIRGAEAKGGLLGREGDKEETARLEVVAEAVKKHVDLCHLLVVSPPLHSPLLRQVFKFLLVGEAAGAVVVVMAAATGTIGEGDEELPTAEDFREVVGFPSAEGVKLSCRAVLLFSITPSDTNLTLSFMESAGLWRHPETRVVVVGVFGDAEKTLLHPSLRNAVHAHYFALSLPQNPPGEGVAMYARCLYCGSGGEAAVYLVSHASREHQVWLPEPSPAPDVDMRGHFLRGVVLENLPYVAVQRVRGDSRRLLALDSVGVRLLNALSHSLNFTYEMVEPQDGLWGTPVGGGGWNGIVGTLQRQEADFSCFLSLHFDRVKVMSFSVPFAHDPLIIISLKPSPLSQHMALTRPFAADVWVATAAATVVLGVTMWVLQRAWSWLYGERALRMFPAFCYSWGILLERPLPHLPRHASGKVLVGWWLLTTTVLTAAYRSSLAADLSILSYPPPINTFEDLLGRQDWAWGSLGLGGADYLFFNQSTDPATLQIFRGMETLEMEAGLKRVLGGRFGFLLHQATALLHINPLHGDRDSEGPIHIGSAHYANPAWYALGARKGAPFLDSVIKRILWLFEMGIIDVWIKEVSAAITYQRKKQNSSSFYNVSQGSHAHSAPRRGSHKDRGTGEVVLGLGHLQGAFYLLLFGHSIAFVTLLGERISITLSLATPVL